MELVGLREEEKTNPHPSNIGSLLKKRWYRANGMANGFESCPPLMRWQMQFVGYLDLN